MGLPAERDHPDEIAKAIVEAVRGQRALAQIDGVVADFRKSSAARRERLEHFWDEMDERFRDRARVATRFRMFVGRFLAATKAHDFTPDPEQRALHSKAQQLIWEVRHEADVDVFEGKLDQAEALLRRMCRAAGIQEPDDPTVHDPEASTAEFHPEPENLDGIVEQAEAVRHVRAKILERHRDLVNRVVPAVDGADYSDPDVRQTAAALRAAMLTASTTTSIPTMQRAMVEAERHLAHLLTGEDPGEEGGSDDGPLY